MIRCTCESDTGYVGACHGQDDEPRMPLHRTLGSFETGKQYEARMRAVQDRLATERDARERARLAGYDVGNLSDEEREIADREWTVRS